MYKCVAKEAIYIYIYIYNVYNIYIYIFLPEDRERNVQL